MTLSPIAKEAIRAAVKEIDGINAKEVKALASEVDQAHDLICSAVAIWNMEIKDQKTTEVWNAMRVWLVRYADRRTPQEASNGDLRAMTHSGGKPHIRTSAIAGSATKLQCSIRTRMRASCSDGVTMRKARERWAKRLY
jgi:hypothetical protein